MGLRAARAQRPARPAALLTLSVIHLWASLWQGWKQTQALVQQGWRHLGGPPAPQGAGARRFRPAAQASALERQLRPFATRLRLTRALAGVPRALAWALTLALLPSLLIRLLAGPTAATAMLIVIAGGLFVVLWLRLLVRPVTVLEAARASDLRLHLRERLATAIELLERGDDGSVAAVQVDDATRKVAHLRPGHAFPLYLHRQHLLGLGLAILAALALALWPASNAAIPPSQRLAGAVPADQEPLAETDRLPGDSLAGLTEALASAGDTEEAAFAGQEQGLLGQVDDPAARGADLEASADSQSAAAEQAARQSSQERGRVGERQQALRDLGQALRRTQSARTIGEALLREEYAQAAQEMGGLATSVPDLNNGDREQLASQLATAAQRTEGRDPKLADMTGRAAEALQQYQDATAARALRETAQWIAQTGLQLRQQQQQAQRAQQLRSGSPVDLPSDPAQANPSQLQMQRSRQPLPEVGDPTAGQEAGGAGSDGFGQEGDSSLPGTNGQSDQSGSGQQAGQPGQAPGGAPARGLPHLLNVNGVRTEVEAQTADEGPSVWRPPEPDTPPGEQQATEAPLPFRGLEDVVTRAWDPNVAGLVPGSLESALRLYFTPSTFPSSAGAASSDTSSGAATP